MTEAATKKTKRLWARIEQLEEDVMVLTIALNKIKAKVARDRPDIRVVCEVALTEAGDEDYYDD